MSILTKNVCKDCGKTGRFLKLDADLRCEQCAWIVKNSLTSEEIVEEVADAFHGKGNAKRVRESIKAYEAQSIRSKANFSSVFGSYEKARQLEKEGRSDEALDIYLKLLERCPPGTDYYVRPCIILEKKGDYCQAIEICDLAIQHIQEGRFQADVEVFIHRRERLERKRSKSS